jgi:hypothetical protein
VCLLWIADAVAAPGWLTSRERGILLSWNVGFLGAGDKSVFGTLGRRLARRKWTMVKVGLWAIVSSAPWYMAAALPWGGRVWIDVVALGLSIVNSAGAATLLYYVSRVEEVMASSLITEAEVMTILAAKKRLDEL